MRPAFRETEVSDVHLYCSTTARRGARGRPMSAAAHTHHSPPFGVDAPPSELAERLIEIAAGLIVLVRRPGLNDPSVRALACQVADELRAVGQDSADDGDEEMPPVELATDERLLGKALAMPHPRLARRYLETTKQLYAANTYLDLIARGSKHAAVITPEDDPSAKRARPVLTATDRTCHTNAILDIRAAHRGALSTHPVPLYRAAIAANSASDSTVSHAMAQLVRVGLIAREERPDEQGRHLYALPPTMPHEISRDKVLAFDSPRRATERLRPCPSCGGTAFERSTRVRIACLSCGDIMKDKTHVIKLSDYDDGAAGMTAEAEITDRVEAHGTHTPVANCNTYVVDEARTSVDEGGGTGNSAAVDGGALPTGKGAKALQFATASRTVEGGDWAAQRRQAIGADRAAARGHRDSDDHCPRPVAGVVLDDLPADPYGSSLFG